MTLDLESPDLEFRRYGRGAGAVIPPPAGCYAISAVDGSIATSQLGPRASFVCPEVDSFYAISAVDGAIATSELGDRATYDH